MSDFTTRYLKDYQASPFNIESVDLTFQLADNNTLVDNKMRIKPVGQESQQETQLILDGEHLTLLTIEINGQPLTQAQYQVSDSQLTLLNVPNEAFELFIRTEISPIDNKALEGLYKSGDAYCTQCEAEGFRRITYYLDRPDVLAVFTTKIIADKSLYPYLLSNGNKIATGELADNKHFVTWHDPHPKPCYLFALVAGDFDLLSDSFTTASGKPVALEIFVDKGNLPKASHAMASLKASMKWDEEVFGLEYDLDIYMIVAVDFFNMGAMENKGLNVFNSKFVLADEASATDTDYFNIEAVIAHEYFHNWTGNRVTCRDWFQLSLKEGLTVFRDQQFSADLNSKAVTRIQNVRVLRSQQFAEDASPMAHPIRPEKVMEMNNFYTLTVYEKGAEVIRMIHTLLGVEKFRAGMDLYFQRFDGMAVTCDDFVNAMADASGIDLTLFKRWYSQSGTPKLIVQEAFDNQNGQFTLTVKQEHKATAAQTSKLNLHIPIGIELLVAGKTPETHLLELTEQQQTWQFNGFENKPTVAFLTNFTAPVKVAYQQSDAELEQIMVLANDEFCRWDAGQKLLMAYINKLIEQPDFVLPVHLTEVFRSVLTADIDPALIAEQLTLPSFDEIADNIEQVDPALILSALDKLKYFIAEHLQNDFTVCYQHLLQQAQAGQPGAANRALANCCLGYLALTLQGNKTVEQHFAQSTCMTDSLAALTIAAKNALPVFNELSERFEQTWYDTTLVMDKWFSVRAVEDNPEMFIQLEKLLAHPLFNIENPNRARSLIGAFMMNNPKYFHCQSGRGYEFLAAQIKLLNSINPQVAARLITPLLAYKRYEPVRQGKIKAQLELLAALPNLSNDLQEKISAALTA